MSALDHKRPSRPGPGSTGRLILPIAIFCAVLAGTRPALADFPSYWVYLFAPFSAWWATVLGTLLEGFFVWNFLKVRWYWAFTGVVIANIFSTLAGWAFITYAGVPLHVFLPPIALIIVGQILVPVINTAIEMPILYVFRVRWEWRSVIVIYAANFLSVALLVWPLMLQNYLAFQKYLAS